LELSDVMDDAPHIYVPQADLAQARIELAKARGETERAEAAQGALSSFLAQAREENERLRDELARTNSYDLQARLSKLEEAISWLMGEGDSDFYSEAEREERGLPIYWWRTEFDRRIREARG
jgi:predicted negative regulator of RcsB-dependent stress response